MEIPMSETPSAQVCPQNSLVCVCVCVRVITVWWAAVIINLSGDQKLFILKIHLFWENIIILKRQINAIGEVCHQRVYGGGKIRFHN